MDRAAGPMLIRAPYALGDWWIVPEECLVRRTAAPPAAARKLTPRAMEVLLYLSERPGEVVSTDELLDALWRGTFTTANGVQKCVTELRNAFDDDARNPRVLQTIPKRGYKLLIAPELSIPKPLTSPSACDGDTAVGRSSASGWFRSAMGASLLALLAVIVVQVFPPGGQVIEEAPCEANPSDAENLCRNPKPTTVAVLRFSAQEPEAQLLADALTDLLVGSLHQIKHLDIAARRDSFGEAAGHGTSREVGERLGVEHVLEGAVRFESDQLQVAVQLINVQSGKELYGDRIVAPKASMFDLQDELAARVMRALKIHLSDVERQAMLQTGTRNTEAFLEHKRAFALVSSGSLEDLTLATRHARRAIEIDPSFTGAYQCLLIAFENLSGFHLTVAQSELVRREVEAVVAEIGLLMPGTDLHEIARFIAARLGNDQLGTVNYLVRGIKQGGRTDMPAAFGRLLMQTGLIDEGEAYQRDYLTERGLPLEPSLHRLAAAGDTQVLLARRRQFMAEYPDDITNLAGQVSDLARIGEFTDARKQLQRLEEMDKEGLWAHSSRHTVLMREGVMPKNGDLYRAFMAHPLSTAIAKGHLAFMYGDVPEGIEHWAALSPLEQRVLLQSLPFMEADYPEGVASHPGYQALLDRLGLGRQWQRYLAAKVSELAPFTGIALTSVPDMQVALVD